MQRLKPKVSVLTKMSNKSVNFPGGPSKGINKVCPSQSESTCFKWCKSHITDVLKCGRMCLEADSKLTITEESPSSVHHFGERVSKPAALIYSALSDVTKVTDISVTVIENELAVTVVLNTKQWF